MGWRCAAAARSRIARNCESVIPAQAGIQGGRTARVSAHVLATRKNWIPACAGMMDLGLAAGGWRLAVRDLCSAVDHGGAGPGAIGAQVIAHVPH